MILTIGTKLKDFIGIPEGCYASFASEGLNIFIAMEKPLPHEIKSLSAGNKFDFMCVYESGVVFLLFKFGSMAWQDATYNSSIGERPTEAMLADGPLTASAYIVDTNDGAVCSMASFTVDGRGFASEVRKMVRLSLSEGLTAEQSEEIVTECQRKYSTQALVNRADIRTRAHGIIGEQPKYERKLRRSLEDARSIVVDGMKYPKALPAELNEFYAYVRDCGHSICAIPHYNLLEALSGDMDMYECCVPVKYVLEKGYQMAKGHVVVDAEYDELTGLKVDDKYYEY